MGEGHYSIPMGRVDMLKSFAKPVTWKQLRSLLGMIGYYRAFIPNFVDHSSVLTPATSSKQPHTVEWTEPMNNAFEDLKQAVCLTASLTIPLENLLENEIRISLI